MQNLLLAKTISSYRTLSSIYRGDFDAAKEPQDQTRGKASAVGVMGK